MSIGKINLFLLKLLNLFLALHQKRRRVETAKPSKPKTKSSCFRNCFLFWWRQHN